MYIVVGIKYKSKANHKGVNYIYVDNPRRYLSKIAGLLYSSKPDNIVAVTGTNGKTSVSYFFKQICDLLGCQSAFIGTLGVVTSDDKYVNKDFNCLTSLPPLELHKTLTELSKDGYTHVALETSSHGISQHRMDHINFKAAGFTNFSQDHLDYHKNFSDYFNAKLKLFNKDLNLGNIAYYRTKI